MRNTAETRRESKRVTDWVKVLRRACLAGRKAIEDNYNVKARNLTLGRGSGGDLTLRIDKVSEDAIYKSLVRDLGKNSFVFFSEELGEKKPHGVEAPVIICDPLDGSHNAQVGIPMFAISLAVLHASGTDLEVTSRKFGDVVCGFILAIASSDEYYALKGRGAYHNRKKIKPVHRLPTAGSPAFRTLAIECGDIEFIKTLISNFKREQVYKSRLLGSAALSLCFLADGAIDGLIFAQPGGARSLDSAAGYLIASEAGSHFSDLYGKEASIEESEISFASRINIAGARTEELLEKLLQIVRPALDA